MSVYNNIYFFSKYSFVKLIAGPFASQYSAVCRHLFDNKPKIIETITGVKQEHAKYLDQQFLSFFSFYIYVLSN